MIYDRRHTREISQFGGISNVMPVFAIVFGIMTMSSIGLPLLNGFIGEFTIMAGALQERLWWAIVAGSGIVLGAAYMLWLYQRMFFGTIDNPKTRRLPDLNIREWAYMVPLMILSLWIGVYPKPFLEYIQQPVNAVVKQVRPEYQIPGTPAAATTERAQR